MSYTPGERAFRALQLLPEVERVLQGFFFGEHIHSCRQPTGRDGKCARGCRESAALLAKLKALNLTPKERK
jgi:hypothetical protein